MSELTRRACLLVLLSSIAGCDIPYDQAAAALVRITVPSGATEGLDANLQDFARGNTFSLKREDVDRGEWRLVYTLTSAKMRIEVSRLPDRPDGKIEFFAGFERRFPLPSDAEIRESVERFVAAVSVSDGIVAVAELQL